MSADERPTQSWEHDDPSAFSVFMKLLATIVLLGGLAMLLFPRVNCGPAAPRTRCLNNLKQVALALHHYHEFHGCFPPAYIADENGNRMHSWRVLLLPFLDQAALHRAYRFDEPWNGPHNRELGETANRIFNCPTTHEDASTTTDFLLVVGPGTLFPGTQSTTKADITDDPAQTIMVVEVANSDVHWMEPRDLHVLQMAGGINPPAGQGISSPHDSGANVAFADGSVRFLSEQLDGATVRAMLTIDGGEEIDDANFK